MLPAEAEPSSQHRKRESDTYAPGEPPLGTLYPGKPLKLLTPCGPVTMHRTGPGYLWGGGEEEGGQNLN